MKVSDSLLHSGTAEPFVGRVSIYRAQTELLLHSVCHLGYITRVGIPDYSFISLGLKQR